MQLSVPHCHIVHTKGLQSISWCVFLLISNSMLGETCKYQDETTQSRGAYSEEQETHLIATVVHSLDNCIGSLSFQSAHKAWNDLLKIKPKNPVDLKSEKECQNPDVTHNASPTNTNTKSIARRIQEIDEKKNQQRQPKDNMTIKFDINNPPPEIMNDSYAKTLYEAYMNETDAELKKALYEQLDIYLESNK